jgi:hypothetical protein
LKLMIHEQLPLELMHFHERVPKHQNQSRKSYNCFLPNQLLWSSHLISEIE